MPINTTRLFNLFTLLLISNIWTLAVANTQVYSGVIAYVSSSVNKQQIRLINPDGSEDRVLWEIPVQTHPSDGIGLLSWHPNGTELAFDSGHNWQRSSAIRDIYSISADGTGYRNVTNSPGAERSGDYPTGTVKFTVGALEQGDVQIYVQGMAEPFKYFARQSLDYILTLNVADWGEGVRQYIRLFDPGQSFEATCRFSQEGWVDIIPNQTVDLGRVPFASNAIDDGCPRLFNPSWSQDGEKILYLSRNLHDFGGSKNNDIKEISPVVLPGRAGSTILNSENVVRAVFGSTEVRKNELLYFSAGDLFDFIRHMTKGIPPVIVEGAVGSSGYASGHEVIDVAWLPDGSGFISSQVESRDGQRNGVIYRYTFADQARTVIMRVPEKTIGKLTISPDGTSIVFEVGREFPFSSLERKSQCPCSLWIVNIDGSSPRELVADGRAPAWGNTSSISTYTSPIDQFFNWAETNFPLYFSSHQQSQEVLGYYIRQYPATNISLGTKNGLVYLYGNRFGGLTDLGSVQSWLQRSGQ